MAAAGFELAEGGAAVIDIRGRPERLAEVRARYAPVVGLLAEGQAVTPEAELLDGLVRLPHVATDLLPLLHTLVRAAQDRSELQRQADDLSALVDVTGALASGGDPERLL
ncbi:MAG TPA: hypothetical protein VN928_09155, partial [Myxococcales bacterium]|nr:hypothetical protein [Myxococcales bacterium]